MSAVSIAQDVHIERAVELALARLPLSRLVRAKVVAVKPNDTWASEGDTKGVTQADTLDAVLSHIEKLGPREIVVTGGSGSAQTDEVFRLSGMMEVVRKHGAQFFDHNRAPFITIDLPGVSPQRSVVVNPRVEQYDTLISLAQLKLHETATVTLALKNIAMSFPAADHYGYPRSKRRHHNEFFADMHSFIAAMAKRFPIDVAIIAGHPAMIGTGPLGGHTVETGLVIASVDPLAADVVGAQLLGFDVQAVRHLWEAARLGIGESDTDRMTFPGMSLTDAIRAFTSAAYGEPLDFQHA